MSTLNPQYAECLFPNTVRVLGVELQPLTIGSTLLLWRYESPFMVGGEVQIGHLVMAMYVLSRPCSVAAAGLRKRRTKTMLRWWGRQIKWLTRKETQRQAKTELADFIDGSFKGPSVWESETASTCKAPYLQALKIALQATFGMNSEDALNYPVQLAIWDLACDGERHGRVDWVSAEDCEAIRGALN